MYVEPLTIYREYIQNAVDAIDEAVALNLIDYEDARYNKFKKEVENHEQVNRQWRKLIQHTVESTIAVDQVLGTFTSTAGNSADDPTDPEMLTDVQASNSVAFFFPAQNGYMDARFCVTYDGAGTGTGADILFAGSSSLCAVLIQIINHCVCSSECCGKRVQCMMCVVARV